MQSTALALISCEQTRGEIVHTEVPRYDAIIYCDLGIEPAWVPEQVKFIEAACRSSGIPFYILRSDLYRDYMKNFGVNRVSAMPFWTLNEEGEAGRIARRSCTVDYKIVMIQKFVRYELLGYRPYQRLCPEDIGTHELHIGFSHFFHYIQRNYPDDYASVVDFDEMLAKRQPMSRIRNRVFLSRSRKRIRELTCQDCDDAQTFEYRGRQLWNGF